MDYLLSIVGELYECYGVYGKMDMEQRTYNLDAFKKKKNNDFDCWELKKDKITLKINVINLFITRPLLTM